MRSPASPEVRSRYRLGDWLVDEDTGELVRGAERRQLEPRAMAVLSHLVAARPRVVSRSELLRSVWTGEHVTDGVVWRAIYLLRQALGDEADEPTYLRTVSGRGYQLVAPVLVEGAPTGSRPPRWSVVAALLAGGVGLGLGLVSSADHEPPNLRVPPEAATEYLALGRQHYHGDFLATGYDEADLARAAALFERAVAEDPELAPAWAELAAVRALQGIRAGDRDQMNEAVAAAERAMALDPSDPATHRAVAMAARVARRLDDAAAALERALELDPSDPTTLECLAVVELKRGRYERARRLLDDAITAGITPSRLTLRGQLALLDDDPGSARREFDTALRLDPLHPAATNGLIAVDLLEGAFDDARRRAHALLERSPHAVWLLVTAAKVEQWAGEPAAARRLLETATRFDDQANGDLYLRLAQVALALGDTGTAGSILEMYRDRAAEAEELATVPWHHAARFAAAAAMTGREETRDYWLSRAREAHMPEAEIVQRDPMLAPAFDRSS